MIIISKCCSDDAIEMSSLCEDVRICLRLNDIRLVMNCLCALLWHDDDNVLITHMRVVFKEHSHAITNELMTMNLQGVSLLWPKIIYDC